MRKCSKTFRERGGGNHFYPREDHAFRNDKRYNLAGNYLLHCLFLRAGLPTCL